MNTFNKEKNKKKRRNSESPTWDVYTVINCLHEIEGISTIQQDLMKLSDEINLSFCQAGKNKQDYISYIHNN
jgi:hypothetical protein